jgi:hypothetical protein
MLFLGLVIGFAVGVTVTAVAVAIVILTVEPKKQRASGREQQIRKVS